MKKSESRGFRLFLNLKTVPPLLCFVNLEFHVLALTPNCDRESIKITPTSFHENTKSLQFTSNFLIMKLLSSSMHYESINFALLKRQGVDSSEILRDWEFTIHTL